MLRPGHGVALLTIALLVFGVVMVNSAGLVVGSSVPNVTYESVFLGAPMQHALIAVVALLAAWVVNVMYCQPGEEDAGGGGAGEAPGAGGPGAAVAVHPPAPPLFEGRP